MSWEIADPLDRNSLILFLYFDQFLWCWIFCASRLTFWTFDYLIHRSSYFSCTCLTEFKIRYSVTYIVAVTSIQVTKVTVDVFLVIICLLTCSTDLIDEVIRSFISRVKIPSNRNHCLLAFIYDLPDSWVLYL